MSKPTHRENLEYSQSMLRQLRDMASADRDAMLCYLVEMAYLEASDLLRCEVAEPNRKAAKLTKAA